MLTRTCRQLSVILTMACLLAAKWSAATPMDFSVTKDPTTGIITFTDNNAAVGVVELLVVANVLNGISGNPGTTLPGWSTENLSFGTDPLGCNPPSLGATFTTAVCYRFTGPGGGPITNGVTTFTYDSSFDVGNNPVDFAAVFNIPGDGSGACFGSTGGDGCSAPAAPARVPEPPVTALLLSSCLCLVALGRKHNRR